MVASRPSAALTPGRSFDWSRTVATSRPVSTVFIPSSSAIVSFRELVSHVSSRPAGSNGYRTSA
jgi:hypothetical protein